MNSRRTTEGNFQGDGLAKLACSCLLGEGRNVGSEQANPSTRSAAFVQSISHDEISFGTCYPLAEGHTLPLTISPLGDSPFTCKVKVIENVPSSDKGFYLTKASFEEIAVDDQQKLANLLITISQIRKQMSDC